VATYVVNTPFYIPSSGPGN